MTIASYADYRSALKQTVSWVKATTNNTNARWNSDWLDTGLPLNGSNNPGNTTTGLVPTNATQGAVAISPFGGTGYITRIEASQSVQAGRIMIADRLFHAGSFTAAANTTFNLASQPSFSSRLPTVGGSPDYTGLLMYFEVSSVTAGASATVTYTDDQGNAGHTATPQSPGTLDSLGNTAAVWCSLAAGDRGIQKIESVSITIAGGSVTCQLAIVRPLFIGRIPAINREPIVWQLDQTKMPIVFTDSCLQLLHSDDANGQASVRRVDVEIASL